MTKKPKHELVSHLGCTLNPYKTLGWGDRGDVLFFFSGDLDIAAKYVFSRYTAKDPEGADDYMITMLSGGG